MAKAKVVHSQDGCTIIFKGNPASPEPSTAVIKFPGGHVEVSRTSVGEYWAHISVDEGAAITDSRIDYNWEAYEKTGGAIPPLPAGEDINKLALLINGDYRED